MKRKWRQWKEEKSLAALQPPTRHKGGKSVLSFSHKIAGLWRGKKKIALFPPRSLQNFLIRLGSTFY